MAVFSSVQVASNSWCQMIYEALADPTIRLSNHPVQLRLAKRFRPMPHKDNIGKVTFFVRHVMFSSTSS